MSGRSVFLDSAWLAATRRRAAAPGLAAARRALDETLARYHAYLPPVPEVQAGYYHDYFCPRHATQLVYDPASPHRHVCPIDGEAFSGEPFDSAWRWSVNDQLSDAALRLSVRAALAGPSEQSDRDVARAREILLDYADRYRTMPPLYKQAEHHPGIVTWTCLDESVWVTRMAWAHALLGDALGPGEHERVREGMLRPAVERIFRYRIDGVHNATNWNNAAILTLGLALGDEEMVAEALGRRIGLAVQLGEGVRADGHWWEGSLSYHYYSLGALLWTLRALRVSGRHPVGEETLRRMLLAPIRIALPDRSLPAVHDCWYFIGLIGEVGHGIPSAAGFYEVAYGWYGDPLFGWVLRENYREGERTSLEALLDGAAEIAEGEPPALESCLEAASGFAVIRAAATVRPGAPRERQGYLMLRAGPDGGEWHGHPDQLGIQLYAAGERLTPDLGTPGYGIALNDTWYKQTASHATFLIDGRSQPLATGTIDRFEVDPACSIASGTVAWEAGAYAGVAARRTILWRDAFFVDRLEVRCGRPRQVDLLFHCRGEAEAVAGVLESPALAGEGYAHVERVRELPAGTNALRWSVGEARLAAFLDGAAGERRYLGESPSNPASETQSTLVRRAHGERVVVATTYAHWLAGDEEPGGPLHGRVFAVERNDGPDAQVGPGTRLWFYQRGARVEALYGGGRVVGGAIEGELRDGRLAWRYWQLADDGRWYEGEAEVRLGRRADGRLELVDSWRWSDGRGAGSCVMVEA